jgi:hypothetical protein
LSLWRRCAGYPSRPAAWLEAIASGEGALPSDVAGGEERLDLHGALVGEKGFHVAHVAYLLEIQQDPVATFCVPKLV